MVQVDFRYTKNKCSLLALLMSLNWTESIELQVNVIFSDSLSLIKTLQNFNIFNDEL